jgi:cyclopropane fatty-acyl-phospholipid synthase-like methyltransferase
MKAAKFDRLTVVVLSTISWLLLIVTAACWGQAQKAPGPAEPQAKGKAKVDPEINAPFQKADVKGFIKRFESDDREVFVKRHEITRSLGLKPGMAVADIGAGTGLFSRLFADEVGSGGKVYSVDISQAFLDHIAAQARKKGQPQIVTIRGTQDSTNLPARSIDLAFLCDVYHHLENYQKLMASIHQALRPCGQLVLVEFNRVEGKSSDFVLKHIRAGQQEFRREIESAGFQPIALPQGQALSLKENFMARFEKRQRIKNGGKANVGRAKKSTAQND